jgi:hypothetical protein
MVRTKQGRFIVCFGLATVALLGCQEEAIQQYQVAKANRPREELGYSPPDGWKKLGPDPNGFYQTGFQVTEGEQAAQFTITPLDGPAGDLVSNANRWRRQLHLEAVNEEQLQKHLQEIRVAGVLAKYLDLTGPEEAGQPSQRMFVVVAPRSEKTWFFKIMGPALLVEKQKPAFDAFIRSVTFDGPTGNEDGKDNH